MAFYAYLTVNRVNKVCQLLSYYANLIDKLAGPFFSRNRIFAGLCNLVQHAYVELSVIRLKCLEELLFNIIRYADKLSRTLVSCLDQLIHLLFLVLDIHEF